MPYLATTFSDVIPMGIKHLLAIGCSNTCSETAAGSSWLGMPATAESEAVTEPRAMPAAVSSQAKSGSVHSSAGQPKQNCDESLHSAGWMHPWLPKTRSTAIGLLLAVETCATMTATIERAMRAATLR